MTPSLNRLFALAAASIPACGGLALAQQPTSNDPGSKQPDLKHVVQTPATTLLLADEPYRLDTAGLSVRFPAGCQIKSNRIGDRQTAQIVPEGSTWIINIQTPVTSADTGTIPQAMEQTISLIRGSYSIVDPDQKEVLETQAKILEQTNDLKLAGGPAGRLYVSTPRGDKSRLLKGYTIFKPQPRQFVVFEFICHEQDFAKLRGTYETIVGTALFENSDGLALQRGGAIKAGVALIQGLSEQDYLNAMGDKEAWYRLYKPGKTGAKMDDEELGYKGVKFWRGKRGEINPSKPRTSWSKTDDQDGWLASNRSRVLWNGQLLDTLAIYFMTPDRNEECWNIATSVKEANGQESSTATETGARIKDDMRIIKTATKRQPVTMHPPILGEGYISQLETMILPKIILARKPQLELGFYCWQDHSGSDSGTISFRKDMLAVQGSVSTLTTTLRDDSAPQVSVYNEKGDLTRSELPGNMVWEPVELSNLRRNWQQKGLPVDR